jgi:hypothetical protein
MDTLRSLALFGTQPGVEEPAPASQASGSNLSFHLTNGSELYLGSMQDVKSVEIFDVMGRSIGKMGVNGGNIVWEKYNLNNQVYFIKLSGVNKTQVKRLVLAR